MNLRTPFKPLREDYSFFLQNKLYLRVDPKHDFFAVLAIRLLAARLGKSRQVSGDGQILQYRLLAARLGKSRQV